MSASRGEPVTRSFHGDPFSTFLADGGILELPVVLNGVHQIRIELGARQFLHLQSIEVCTRDGMSPTQIAGCATVTASSWYKGYADKFSGRRLFDFEHSSGTQIHTAADDPPWIDISFAEALDLDTIRLRNVSNGTWARAATLRLSARTGDGWALIFDASASVARIASEVHESIGPLSDQDRANLETVITDTITARYLDARTKFEGLELDAETKRRVKGALNEVVLAPRSLSGPSMVPPVASATGHRVRSGCTPNWQPPSQKNCQSDSERVTWVRVRPGRGS